MKQDIDRLIAEIAPDPGPGLTDGARELLTEITALPVPAAGAVLRRRRRVVLPLVAALAMTAVVLSWILPGLGTRPASAALDIRREGGYYVVTVRNLFAAPKLYQAQLRAKHLDITLSVVPVSPSLVGGVFLPFDKKYNGMTYEELARNPDLIAPIHAPGTCTFSVHCTIGVKVPVGYRGHAGIELGRKGRPGERYRGFGQLNNPGEPLQCENFVNKTFDQVRAMLRARGVTITTIYVPLRGIWPSVPGHWYVHEGWLSEQGKAVVVAAPTPNPTPFSLADSGCPAHH
jgi:hypothetical protein